MAVKVILGTLAVLYLGVVLGLTISMITGVLPLS